ncbi:MAG TPA: trypsin-like peptidase domain-containing protein [Actinomycetota bacterium]|jgi:S1-C subfamily serine protease|nr:trypsin-like peptidase domain-containing protein [Actinomycetota bacterium]
MSDHMNPQGSEPWTGYHAGMPAPPPTPGGAGPHRARGWIALLVGMLVTLALVGGLLAFNGGPQTAAPTIPSTGATVPLFPSGNPSASTGATPVGTVVDINTSQQVLGADGLRPLGAGTGMVLTADGEILTNNHVVEGASSIQVTIPGHGSSTATVVGVDPTDDVALLQLNSASGLATVTLGDSSTVQVGDPITAIGNAFGRGGPPTSTTGTVAAVHRSITAQDPSGNNSERLNDVIQIAADVHPGDSGGAVLNAQGQVVGIITAGPSNSSGNGTGFAIPINSAIGIVNEIRAGHGSSEILLGERGFMGVAVQPVDPAAAAQLGLGDTSGVLVAGVQPGSPAAKVGMTAPAIIRSIDGQTINSQDELGAAIHSKVPGEQIQVTWIDQQGQHSATITLSSGPAV